MSPNQTSADASSTEVPQSTRLSKLGAVSTANLYCEEERLKTFRDWPSRVMSPEELAANGFYHTGVNDVARCVFCGLEVGEWQEDDQAGEDHKKYSPNCAFVKGRPCGNIPLSESSPSTSPACSSSSTSSSPSYDTCGPFGYVVRPFSAPERNCSLPGTLLENLEKLGVSKISKPAHPLYSTFDARIRSYTKWLDTCPAKPDELAAAGFFSTGDADCVVCFQCGGGLKDWEVNDDPWVEHARWFSRCNFVLMHKGSEYVALAQTGKPPILSAEAINGLMEERQRQPCEETTPPQIVDCHQEKSDPISIEPEVACSSSDEGPESSAKEMELCKICYSRPRGIVFLPCGHFVSCAMCAAALRKCPVCRKPFEATVRAFLS